MAVFGGGMRMYERNGCVLEGDREMGRQGEGEMGRWGDKASV